MLFGCQQPVGSDKNNSNKNNNGTTGCVTPVGTQAKEVPIAVKMGAKVPVDRLETEVLQEQ